MWQDSGMNKFEAHEQQQAEMILREASFRANTYAQQQDREAATQALLLIALELSGFDVVSYVKIREAIALESMQDYNQLSPVGSQEPFARIASL